MADWPSQGGGHVIEDEGASVTQRSNLSAADAGGKTVVTIPGSGSATITTQKDDVNVDAATSTLDFLGTDFDVVSGPAGEANVNITANGIGATELDEAAVEAGLEAVLDLPDLQGAVTDAQVPNTITIDAATSALKLDNGVTEYRIAYSTSLNCYFRDKDRDDVLDLADGELCYGANEYWVDNPVADLQTAINSVCTEPDDLDRNSIIRIPGGDFDFTTTAITVPDPCNGLIIKGVGRRPFRDGWLTGDNAVGTSLTTSRNGDFITLPRIRV
jgi:hypothetical protein